MTKKPELKPCPLCGKKVSCRRSGSGDWYISCAAASHDVNVVCLTKSRTIEVWNTRFDEEVWNRRSEELERRNAELVGLVRRAVGGPTWLIEARKALEASTPKGDA